MSKRYYTFRIIATVLFLVTLVIFFQCSYSSSECLELLKKAEQTKYDIVIVPGIPFENGKWTRIMKGRVYWAKYLWDQGIAKNLMFSGGAVHTPYIEAVIMAMYAQALGIPPKHIFIETRAEHSTENVFYAYRKSLQSGFTKVALATDPFQAKMLTYFTHTFVNADIGIIPFVTDTLKAMHDSMVDPVIDYEKAFVPGFVSLSDRQNLWERLQGTRGLFIDYNAYR